jgi:hypothetical protein
LYPYDAQTAGKVTLKHKKKSSYGFNNKTYLPDNQYHRIDCDGEANLQVRLQIRESTTENQGSAFDSVP